MKKQTKSRVNYEFSEQNKLAKQSKLKREPKLLLKLTVLFVILVISNLSLQAQYSGGTGIEAAPYIIANLNDLKYLSEHNEDWNKHFKQTADIDATATNTWNVGDHDEDSTTPDVAMGFSPIGSIYTEFKGTYNGENYKISNIYINRPKTNYTAIFGSVENACISNLGAENVNITGEDYIGSIAGETNKSKITNCYATGELTGTGTEDGRGCVGGIVGCNISSKITNCYASVTVEGHDRVGGIAGLHAGIITNCYATGEIQGNNRVGGIAGDNFFEDVITNCYSSSKVIGNEYVGGIVGDNGSSEVTDCYATGEVQGNNKVGGIAGYHGNIITNCYSTGAVTGSTDVGGLIGYNNEGTVTNSYWDTQASGQSSSAGGTGKPTQEMKVIATYENWNFSDTWRIDYDGSNNGYPTLAWQGLPHNPGKTTYSGGEGTEANPYLIANIHDLRYLSKHQADWVKHFKQTADIDATETKIWNIGDHDQDPATPDAAMGFSPIGILHTEFKGTYNGNNHKISNIYINRPKADDAGIFGATKTSNAKIYNLGAENVNIKGKNYVGGIVSSLEEGCSVENCYATGQIEGNNYVGGFVGFLGNGSASIVITNCYSTVKTKGNDRVGGFVGSSGSNNKLTNCYATGLVIGNINVGGFAGASSSVTTNCYWDKETTGQSSSNGGTGKTTAEMKQRSTYVDGNWDFPDTWHHDIDLADNNGYPTLAWQGYDDDQQKYSGGTGMENDPYIIANLHDLKALSLNSNDWDKHFKQTADIDAEETKTWNVGDHDEDASTAERPMGFLAIGKFGNDFTGTYKGENHKISNIYINDTYGFHMGIFGCLKGKISDLGAENVNITGSLDVGSIAAYVYENAEITNCHATGSISGKSQVGGIAGTQKGKLTRCYTTLNISGDDDVGGIAGENRGELSLCYATGKVSGNNNYAGGLVGRVNSTTATITNCYARGDVDGNAYVGGLVGYNQNIDAITNCYASAYITGNNDVGGLIGASSDGTVIDSYYNRTYNSAGGEYKPTEEMYNVNTYKNWDFPNVWHIDYDGNDKYPSLAYQNLPHDTIKYSGGTGTENDPYIIANLQDLKRLSLFEEDDWSKHFKQTADIDATETNTWEVGNHDYDPDTPDEAMGFSPLGYHNYYEYHYFEGTYNGNNHTISNIYINRPIENYVGVFGVLNADAKVYNLGLENVNITGNGYVGGFAGYNNGTSSSISNCYTIGKVSGNEYVGGFAGYNNEAAITNCYARGEVSGNDYVGGFAGYNKNNAKITNCYTTTKVTVDASASNKGGFLGHDDNGTVTHSYWDTETTGQSSSAGGTGKTTAEMKDNATYEGWSFGRENDKIWHIDIGGTDNDAYPSLAWQGLKHNILFVLTNPLPDITVDENATVEDIDLSNVFTDADGDAITKTIQSNSNENLLTASISGNTLSITLKPNKNGEATIVVKATSNGQIVTDEFKVTVNAKSPTYIPNISSIGIKVYPNPVTNHLYVDNAKEITHIQILNVSGKVVRSIKHDGSDKLIINTGNLLSGIYILHISSNLDNYSTKFVKQ